MKTWLTLLLLGLTLAAKAESGVTKGNDTSPLTPLPGRGGEGNQKEQTGVASWYVGHGARMANGQRFQATALTAASWFYPLGTVLEVRNGRRVVRVTVTDRGPARRYVRRGRVIDLTPAAFARLADLDRGLVEVRIAACGGGVQTSLQRGRK